MFVQPNLFSLIESFASPDAGVYLHGSLRPHLHPENEPPPPPSNMLTPEQFEAALAILATSGSQAKQNLSRYLSRENLTLSPEQFTLNSLAQVILNPQADHLNALKRALEVQKADLKSQAAFVFRDFQAADTMKPFQFAFVLQQLKTYTLEEIWTVLPNTIRPASGNVTELFTLDDFATYQHHVAHFQLKSVDVSALFKGYQQGASLNALQYRLVSNLIEKNYSLKALSPYIGETDVRTLFTQAQRQNFRMGLGEKDTEQVDQKGKRLYKFEMDGEVAYEEIEEGPENDIHYVELSRKLGFDPRSIESAKERFKVYQAQNPGLIKKHGHYLYVLEKGRVLLIPPRAPLEQLKQVVFLEEEDVDLDQAIAAYEENRQQDAFVIAPDGTMEKFFRFRHSAGYQKMLDTVGYDARNMTTAENHYLKHLNTLESIEGHGCLLSTGGRVLFAPLTVGKDLNVDGPDHRQAREQIRQVKFYDTSGIPLEGDALKYSLTEFLKAFQKKGFVTQIRPYTHFKIDVQTGKMECSNPFIPSLPPLTVNFHYYVNSKKKKGGLKPKPAKHAAAAATPGLGEALH